MGKVEHPPIRQEFLKIYLDKTMTWSIVMHRGIEFILLYLSVFLVPLVFSETNPFFQDIADLSTRDCEELAELFFGNPDWSDKLANPVLESETQVEEMVSEVVILVGCIENIDSVSITDKQTFSFLSGLFLEFVVEDPVFGSETRQMLVDLGKSDDPAVKKMRDEVGLPPPAGYIFIRFYPSVQDMPKAIQEIFASKSVSGATIFSRYIAILNEEKPVWQLQALENILLPKTVSHELVHAYVNASQKPGSRQDLPVWFQEGLATYFSGSTIEHIYMTPEFKLVSTSPQEYVQFDLNFRYLERMHGSQRLYELIHGALKEVDASVVYRDLGISGLEQLSTLALSWRKRSNINRMIVGIVFLALTAILLYRRLPEIRCENCGYTGKRKDFTDSRCPECHQFI